MHHKSNGGGAAAGVHQACAACKHQRKKCSENCALAPFFPSEKTQQFQAVHKVFGVSNVSKLLRNFKTREECEKAIETLIWEAQWRQVDPVLGCYGQYKKVYEELKMLKNQQVQVGVPSFSDAMLYKTGLIGWNNGGGNNNNNNNGGEINFNNLNYVDSNGSFAIEMTPFDYNQGQESNGAQVISQQFYLPDQYGRMNVKMDKAV